jgi:cell division protease FtsH
VSWLKDRIKIAMGGYVSEELIYHETTTGTKNDIEQATTIARRMVTEWGMSKTLGFMSLGQEDEPIFIGKEIAQHKDYSDETARSIDLEIKKILDECLDETRDILKYHVEELKILAEELIQKETMEDAEIRELLGFPKRTSTTSLKGEIHGPTLPVETAQDEGEKSNAEAIGDEKSQEEGRV